MTFKFPLDAMPAHEKYGFGAMSPGDTISVDLDESAENATKIRGHIGAHAAYYSKKFKTKCHDGKLYIQRLS